MFKHGQAPESPLLLYYRDFYNKYHMVKKKNYALRFTADEPIQEVYAGHGDFISAPLVSDGEDLCIMVWNIYKQQRDDWLSVLKSYSAQSHLMLLQEAQSTPELVDFATSHYVVADQVPAINFPLKSYHSSGVMTLANTHPMYCCPLRQQEPLLRLSKSALITVYPLVEDQFLMVINVHAVNFSLGVDVYYQQLEAIGDHLTLHDGPVIFAGDFNTWSRKRLNLLYRFARVMRLQKVNFSFDFRIKAFGLPLDFIFYRGMKVKEARVVHTEASDHNPLFVRFGIQ